MSLLTFTLMCLFKSFLSGVAAVPLSQGSDSHLRSIFAIVTGGISLEAHAMQRSKLH